MVSAAEAYDADGFVVLPKDARVAAWAAAALPEAKRVASDPEWQAKWLRHQQTWFVGVDALPNDENGAIGGVALQGPWEGLTPWITPLHKAQVSVVYPGYPRRDADESEANHRYRTKRDAAHVDGIHAEGPERRRFLREAHAWILGIPLNAAKAAPLVVWPGSHVIMRDAFMSAFAGLPTSMWGEIDLTEIYTEARAEVFETCERVEVPLALGQSILVHRLTLHGVAPWGPKDSAPPEGRAIAYFRPEFKEMRDWLRAD